MQRLVFTRFRRLLASGARALSTVNTTATATAAASSSASSSMRTPAEQHAHYHRPALTDAILAALQQAGKPLQALTPADLAPVDQFHTRGKPATLELARAAKVSAHDQVLDVGCAVGGPARTLAEFGCTVVGIDVMEEYITAAQRLTSLVGLEQRVSFRVGDALALPFAADSFDVVWSQHVSMNIADKATFYREVYRVLRPRGRFAFSDICSIPHAAPPVYPVPWSRLPETSHLVPADAKLQLLQQVGFQRSVWHERSEEAMAAIRKQLDRGASATTESPSTATAATSAASKPPHLGLHLLLGPDAQLMVRNLYENLVQRRVTVVDAVMVKPATAAPATPEPASQG